MISLICPCLNEETSIEKFVHITKKILDENNIEFEIIFIDDGSQDRTLENMRSCASSDARIKAVSLSRNFGKEIALSCGLDYAKGDAVIPIDCDLQDPPELIPKMIELWQSGFDVVYAQRADRHLDSLRKRVSALWFYKLFNLLSSPVSIPENVGDFRLLDRKAVDTIRQFRESHRFMKGIMSWGGFRSTIVQYDRPVRAMGKSKFPTFKLINLAVEGITSFSAAPLRIMSLAGLAVALLSFAYAIYIVTKTIVLGIDVPGYASIITAILFASGAQIFCIGIVGEYIGRIYIEAKRRPLYAVNDLINIDPPT